MRTSPSPWRRWSALVAAAGVLTGALVAVTATPLPSESDECAKRYVAGGDAVVHGKHLDNDSGSDSDRWPEKLNTDHLRTIPGGSGAAPWCVYNTSTDPATTDTFVQGSGSQQAQAWNLKPTLITLELGRQNAVVVDQVDKCFTNIRDHDFLDANTCVLAVLADAGAWSKLQRDLSGILNTYKTWMSGNPSLVVAVVGYYNPYPQATSVATKVPGFCTQLTDTIPTCIARWVLLPPALVTADLVVKKLNDTTAQVVRKFAIASQGRFFFVNPYDKFRDHCMHMKVTIKTQVFHPPNKVDKHDTRETDFGCSDSWVVKDGTTGRKSPFLYLTPAVTGVLIVATQETKEMGVNPNKKGHDCLSDLVWETVKNKLGVPEKPDLEGACS